MNKSDSGKQCNTTIPQSNPDPHCFKGQPQKMTSSGQQKGLQVVLEECGFNVSCLKAKYALVCSFDSQNCRMAQLLSQQENFMNQELLNMTVCSGVRVIRFIL